MQKIKSSFRVGIIIRAGIVGGAVVAYKMLRCAIFKRYKCVFYRMTKCAISLNDTKEDASAGEIIEFGCYDNSLQIESALSSELGDNEAHFGHYHKIEQLLREGNLLFVGRINNKIVSVAWVKDYCQSDNYFFPVPADAAIVYRCSVLPGLRGRNIYPKTLCVVAQRMREKGKNVLFIDCWDYNYPSETGILKAGFRLLGYGWYGFKGQVFWKQVARKPFCE